MQVIFDSILGAGLGFEFLPTALVEDMGGVYGLLIDLLFVRVLIIRMQPE